MGSCVNSKCCNVRHPVSWLTGAFDSTCNHWNNISLYKYIIYSLTYVPALLNYAGVLRIPNESPGLLYAGHHIPLLPFAGIVSGAILQLREEFQLDCMKQEMVVSSMLMGAVLASVTGGALLESTCCRSKWIQVKMNFLCLLTLFIHGSWIIRVRRQIKLRIKLSWNHFGLHYQGSKLKKIVSRLLATSKGKIVAKCKNVVAR